MEFIKEMFSELFQDTDHAYMYLRMCYPNLTQQELDDRIIYFYDNAKDIADQRKLFECSDSYERLRYLYSLLKIKLSE